MVDKSNKNLWIGLAAAGALVGAALLFHWANSGDEEEGIAGGVDSDKLLKSLEAAGLNKPKQTPQGMLDTKYFLDLLQFVGVTSKEQTKGQRQRNLDNRRKAYKDQDWDEYERIVKDTITQEDQACQLILKEVIEALGISEQEFGMTHQTLAANP